MNNLKKKIVALCLTFSMVFSTGTAVFAKEQDDNASPKKVESTMNRIEGRDRFAVANKVMEDYYENSKKVLLVSATKFPYLSYQFLNSLFVLIYTFLLHSNSFHQEVFQALDYPLDRK